MEHSYSKDVHPKGNVEVMATRSILIPRPPQCPSCYHHSANDDILAKMENHQIDPYLDQLPPAINDDIAKMAMLETERLTKNVKNNNPDDDDWDLKVDKTGWSKQQLQLYRQVANILDYDQLARLAVKDRPNEGIIRRCSTDKSVARMRSSFASVHWNTDLTQWLNSIMLTYLPPTYMASYLDILQSLRAKVPTLVDKMLGGRPASFNQDYLQAIMKRPWGANVPTKTRKLPGQSPIIVIVPSTLNSASQQPPPRMKRWFSLLGTMASTAPIQHIVRPSQTLESITEQLIAMTRSKIQDLRNEMPNRHIILVGFNTGAAIALQVALVETVSSIVCMGFAFNTMKGTRGAPDDRILEITTPVLFISGETSARSSQEEIESMRERMAAQTSLVVVGSADDALRINKFNRHLEGVTQSMVDNMIADEIQDFVSTCIVNPPGPRKIPNNLSKRSIGGASSKKHDPNKKRKHKETKADKGPPRKVGRPRLNRSIEAGNLKPEKPKPAQTLINQSNESIKMAVQNIVNEMPAVVNAVEAVTTSETDNIPKANLALPPTMDNGSTLNVSNTQEVSTSENDKKSIDLQTTLALVVPTPSASTITRPSKPSQPAPKILHTPNNQFVQIKPPTTTAGRIQSPNVKNFFYRKGVEKQPSTQTIVSSPSTATFITTQATPSSSVNQLPANKKIIIKSQQIIVPANNMKQNTGQIIHMSSGQPVNMSNTPTPIAISANVIETSANDLSGILDLPILFADNNADGAVQINQSGKMVNATTSSNILLNSVSDRNAQIGSPLATNIFINAPDGKLPNRPVVISAAKMTPKPLPQQQQLQQPMSTTTLITTPTTNKLIFINRNQIKQQIVGTPTTAGHHTQIVKGLSTLKLMPTSMMPSSSTASTSIALQGNHQITKLSPGTKIDLSTLKFVKNPSPIQGSIVKPVIINKAVPGTKSAILIKSPIGANVQAHPVIKGNVLNRNITVRKVMNVVPSVKQITTSPLTLSNVPSTPATHTISTAIITNTSPISVPAPGTIAPTPQTAASPSPSKTTRKTKNSN